MEFSLRCNSLKCRTQLKERAVVTTCSHIFCRNCSDSLGLSAPAGNERLCPACQTSLPNPDDVVSTQLNPTEDYKTSVLSGLNPNTIIECAGRGLAFWSYQSTQEIVYQEYLAKTLTNKYNNLGVEMDKIINDANSEIESLNEKLATMQMDQDKLKSENTNLVLSLRDKQRKHQQTQELYDRLKRKEMVAATQSAAFDSVDEQYQSIPKSHGLQAFPQLPAYDNSFDQAYKHAGIGSEGTRGSTGMVPPHQHAMNRAYEPIQIPTTPSLHRTHFGPALHSTSRLNTSNSGNLTRASTGRLQQTPLQRQPLINIGASSLNRSSVRGYGMSAGVKVGRQQASRQGDVIVPGQERAGARLVHPLNQGQQLHMTGGTYY